MSAFTIVNRVYFVFNFMVYGEEPSYVDVGAAMSTRASHCKRFEAPISLDYLERVHNTCVLSWYACQLWENSTSTAVGRSCLGWCIQWWGMVHMMPVDGSVVCPVTDIVSCSCMLGSVTCPSVGQVLRLLRDAGGPRPENEMLGWTLDVFSENDNDNDASVFTFIIVPVCVYLTVCLAAMALTIARWTGVNVHHEQGEVSVGNTCVTKTGNLYAKDMSLNIALLLISDIFAVAHLLIGCWYQLEDGFKQTFGGPMQLQG